MAERVCPWWLGYLLANPLRRLMCEPVKILAPHVREGMTVLEPGPGMGFFTLELARLVGSSGRVIAVDVQPRMIEGLKLRAIKAGVLSRVDARLGSADSMGLAGLAGTVEFTLAFAVVHELPSVGRFFAEVAEVSKPGACLLLAEPRGHVNAVQFAAELKSASEAGFSLLDRPSVRHSHAALLRKL